MGPSNGGRHLFEYAKGGRGRLIKCFLDQIRRDELGLVNAPVGSRPVCPECGSEVGHVRLIHGFDLVAQVRVGGVERTLLVEVKSSGQPRYLRQVIARFQEAGISDGNVHFLIAAPYISPRGMDVCREHDVGCVDLVGNVYLAFDSVYIERVVEEKPQRRKRWIKNLFAPVSGYLRDKIHELRAEWQGVQLRILYFRDDEYFWLTNGLRKKTKRVPESDINRAVDYRREYFAQKRGE